jgi:type I restriction enzyme, S subunit
MEGWKESYLGNIAKIIMGQSPDSKFYNSEGKGKIFLQGCSEFGKYVPNSTVYSLDIKKIAPSKSILFSVRAPVGKINYAEKEYCIGRGIASISSTTIDTNYLYYFLTFIENNNVYKSQGSTFDSINYDQLKSIAISYPQSKTEQRKIAEILSKVDKAIAQTEKLIAKYKRIKTGMMQDLLTKGIDENGNIRSEETHEFKDSVLGRIPVEWEVNTLESLTSKIVDGVHHTPSYVEEGVPFVVVSDMTVNEGINLKNVRFVSLKDHQEFSKRANPKHGDVLVTKDGTLGIARIVPKNIPEFSIFVSVALLRPKFDLLMPELIWSFFNRGDFKIQLGSLSAGTGLAHIHLEHFRQFQIRKPPLDEQKKIFLIIGKIENQLLELHNTLSKLQKLKTALMQDLLTGKVRVTDLKLIV